jgi:hypothetical protein
MKLLKLLAVMTLACSAAFAAEVSFEASVDRLQTAFEDPVQLELVVRTTDPDITTRPLMPPRLPGFSVGGSSSSVSREGDTIIRRYTYELRPAASGEVRIPALQLEYTDSLGTDTLSSQPIAVQVGEPVPEPVSSDTPLWVAIVAAVVLAVGVWWWVRRSNQARREIRSDWHGTLREQLEEAEKLARRQDYRVFCEKAIHLVIRVLERRYETKLAGHTAGDLVKFLNEKGVDRGQIESCEELTRFCETVKYASGEADADSASRAAACLRNLVEPMLE